MDIVIRGASEHNLRSVDLDLPRERLIVFTGPSGSGKSSLAFDTLHAESQRRFVEAMSSWLRAQAGATKKPAYELLTGLTPSIGVSQRGHVVPSPRSTVGTVTDIHDLLRVLWARTGRQHCPGCGDDVTPTTVDAILRHVAATPPGARLVLLAPVARDRTAGVRDLVEGLGRQGFARVRIDGVTVAIDEAPTVDARAPHDVDVVVDRLKVGPDGFAGDKRTRLQDALDTALRVGDGAVLAEVDGVDHAWSTRARCLKCRRSLPELAPRLFSFNSPVGACPACQGVGVVRTVDPARLVRVPTASLGDGALDVWTPAQRKLVLPALASLGVPLDVPWERLSWEHRTLVLDGDGKQLEGAIRSAQRRPSDAWTDARPCDACGGSRLGDAARAVRVHGRTLPERLEAPLHALAAWIDTLPSDPVTAAVAEELRRRLSFLLRTGLGYLTLSRTADTLSGGELQRLRLAAQAGNQLSGVLYVLDEPTAGLHPVDTAALVAVLRDLRDAGNTVLVVEHDAQVIQAADLVVDFGPGAGRAGGTVVFRGTPDALLASDAPTGVWLSGRERIQPRPTRAPKGWLCLRNARGHNLRGLDVRVPLGVLVGVTGPSGSGKSSLIDDTLGRALLDRRDALPHDGVDGRASIRRVVQVDQAPLGRGARSNPATATRIWDPIRQLLARTPEAKMRGFGPERFSTAVPAGRCEACEGEGARRVEMAFLPDVTVPCEVCDGRRFDEATLAVTWKGANAADVLAMSVREARPLFESLPAVAGVLATLDALGLGYLPLGQASDTLSGGEAQRIKLARELGRPGEVAGTMYLLDEPSVGLHPQDVARLVDALRELVDAGGSVLCVEHDPALIAACDWVIELGPGAGVEGGAILAEGTPDVVRVHPASVTGRWL